MAKKIKTINQTSEATVAVVSDFSHVNRDLVLSVLIVSLVANMFILIGWVALQVTTAYDAEVAAFLFVR